MLFTLLVIYQLIEYLKSTYAVTRNERFKKFEAFKENIKAEVGTEMSTILQYYQTLWHRISNSLNTP